MKIKAVIVDDFIRETIYEPNPYSTEKNCFDDVLTTYAVINGIKIRVPYESKCVVINTDVIKRHGIEEADKLYRRIMDMSWDDRRKVFGNTDIYTIIQNNTYDELSEKLAAYDRKRKTEAKELIHKLEDLGYKVIEYENTVTVGERLK